MSFIVTCAYITGAIVMVAGGFAIAGVLLWVSAWATGKYAWRTWKNMSGVYKMEVMRYWFKRMDAEGTHIVRQSFEEKRATKETA